jgi:hypothetical protein
MNDLKTFTLTSTCLGFNFQNIEFKNLNVFVGANATGKSFIFKTIFGICEGIELVKSGFFGEPTDALQYILKHTFDDFEKLDFKVHLKFTEGNCDVEVDGKVTQFDFDHHLKYPRINYFSPNTRLFGNFDLYLTLKKNVSEEDLLKTIKIYDIIQIEKILNKLPADVKILNLNNEEEDVKIYVKDNKMFMTRSNGTEVRLSSLSNGEQSLIMLSGIISLTIS